MRKIRGAVFVSVDGVMQPGGKVEHGWAGPQSTSDREQARERAMAEGRW